MSYPILKSLAWPSVIWFFLVTILTISLLIFLPNPEPHTWESSPNSIRDKLRVGLSCPNYDHVLISKLIMQIFQCRPVWSRFWISYNDPLLYQCKAPINPIYFCNDPPPMTQYYSLLVLRRCATSQSPPLWTQRSRWRPSLACARSHHLRLGNGSDTICNDPPQMTQYCPLLAPQTRLFRKSPILGLLSQKHA